MLDGNRYFASFPDETAQAANEEPPARRPLTPELLAALAELDRELRTFLKETSEESRAETSNETTDDGQA